MSMLKLSRGSCPACLKTSHVSRSCLSVPCILCSCPTAMATKSLKVRPSEKTVPIPCFWGLVPSPFGRHSDGGEEERNEKLANHVVARSDFTIPSDARRHWLKQGGQQHGD